MNINIYIYLCCYCLNFLNSFWRLEECFLCSPWMPIDGKVADIHVAGTTCVGFCTIGQFQGEHALSHAHFITWSGQRSMIEPTIIQENVRSFPKKTMMACLPEYGWCCACLDPVCFGWPVRRERQFMMHEPQSSDNCAQGALLQCVH